MGNYRTSLKLWERSKKSLAGGVSSNVRAAEDPLLYFEHAQGVQLRDADGNEYLDYVSGQGPMLLGHTPKPIIEAVYQAIQKGQLYAGQHELEIALSEKLQRIIPCAELVRYSNSGSEAVQVALRLARAYTGREKIIKFEGHYHGWFDNVLISVHPSPERAGSHQQPEVVPESTGQAASALSDVVVLPWNDLEVLRACIEQHGDEIAAVIMEPVMCNSGCILPQPGYLEAVRELCSAHGVVLIFDEIITGFRLGLGGAQEYLDVTPDLATFGKAMANGFPISCLAGKSELMDLIARRTVNHSGTFNSNVISIAAALATVTELEQNAGKIYPHLHGLGKQLMTGLRELADRFNLDVLIQGPGPMFHLAFTTQAVINDYRACLECDTARYNQFAGMLLEEGIRVLPRGLWYISVPHTAEDIERTLQVVEKVWIRMREANPM
jgi:glutamate-1-semialdehyde 2,1-aminomutase